jgi:hypothetical protein
VSGRGRGPGRPRRDLLTLFADVVAAREADPEVSIRALARALRVRRPSVRLVLHLLAASRARRVQNLEPGGQAAEESSA